MASAPVGNTPAASRFDVVASVEYSRYGSSGSDGRSARIAATAAVTAARSSATAPDSVRWQWSRRAPSISESPSRACRTVIGWRTRAWLKRMKSETSAAKVASSTSLPRNRANACSASEKKRSFMGYRSAPNTSMPANRHAGLAWPTRINWFGSPLPQYGVPSTATVDASPTIASDRQNVRLTPR